MSDEIGTPEATPPVAPSDWLASLPEALRDAPFLAKSTDATDAVAKLAHAAKLVGTSLRIPELDAPQADRDAFYQKVMEVPGLTKLPDIDDAEGFDALISKLGKPEEYTGYTLPEIAEFEWDEGMGNDLRKYAHEAGLTPLQFKRFAEKIAGQELQAGTDITESTEQQRRELRDDWGDALDSRENLIRGWLKQSDAPDTMMEMLDERKLPAKTMKWLYAVANQFKGDVTPISQQDRHTTVMTPGDAIERRGKIIGQLVGMSTLDPAYQRLQKELIDCGMALEKAS